MPKTLDTHLVGVTTDRPHPESAGADVPLRSEPEEADLIAEAHDEGYSEGRASAEFDAELTAEAETSAHAAVETDLTRQLAAANEEIATLRQQLEAKKSA